MTAIEWTDETWTVVTGCDKVAPECKNCYALEFAPRLRAMAEARGSGKWLTVRDGAAPTSGPAFGVTLHPQLLDKPLRWRKPRKVFVTSMGDLFHEEVPDEFLAEVFATMALAQRHTFQVLTKRPERMRDLLKSWRFCKQVMAAISARGIVNGFIAMDLVNEGPLPNVWCGTTIGYRSSVHLADVLRETPAVVRFISAEPLLGPLVTRGDWPAISDLSLRDIHWLIVGGESGPNHRPIREEWVRDLLATAQREDTAFFLKQWGGRTPKAGGRELDGRTWDEFPEPRARAAA